MSEDIYAKPDLTKKVKFQMGEEDDKVVVCENTDDVRIYDNYRPQGSTPPKVQDSITEDQRQTNSANEPSGKKNCVRPAGMFLVLLCLLLLAVVIVLVVLWIQEKRLNANQTRERDDLQSRYDEMERLNVNQTRERDDLQSRYDEMERLNDNLTRKTNRLEEDIDLAMVLRNNLTKQRDELQKQLEMSQCHDSWMRFDTSCYWIPTMKKNWDDSKQLCESYNATLMIPSSLEEHKFLRAFDRDLWIGLSDAEKEGEWKWVNGSVATMTYWGSNQPDNYNNNEDCAVYLNNRWNDLRCDAERNLICEKILYGSLLD